MEAFAAPSKKAAQHRRRDHKKSRLGCRNCKLRRVKCDESKPQCQKCLSYRVSCNYDPRGLDLQGSIDTIVEISAPSKNLCSENQIVLSAVNDALSLQPSALPKSYETYQLDMHDLELLCRFQTRTILCLGTTRSTSVYQKEIPRLACLHPYLMHAVMTMTARHDRYLSNSPNLEETPIENYHLHQSAALFNQKLWTPMQSSDCDAVWATAIILGTVAMSSVGASTIEEAWPLKPSSPSDLQWLKISDGKKAIWNITAPFRPESVFHVVAKEYKTDFQDFLLSESNTQGLPPELFTLCNINDLSTPQNNPYHSAVNTLVTLQNIECNHSTILKFLFFITYLHADFISLLERKDPRALLLLAFWYARVCHYQWWISRRAMLECKAICIYLQRYHAYDTVIQELLRVPKMGCGLSIWNDGAKIGDMGK